MYCLVRNNKIISGPNNLPVTWNDLNGNTIDLSLLTTSELAVLGWIPFIASTVLVRDIYDTIKTRKLTITASNVTEEITLVPLVLQTVKDQKTDIISGYAENMLDGTITFNGNIFTADSVSRQNVIGLSTAIANGVPFPTNFTWADVNGNNIPMTSQDIVAMGATLLTWVNTIYGVSLTHTTNINKMTLPNDVINYDHTIGWPV